ncbi:1-acyl-sn-glycerol-3-phosphate acyltransferase [Roseobacter sp. HKCCA0434]|uniref:1-acyl-sn-glycerol-3-phosphate acyltransferase n=1 Tax=Roseobacter sp. HKCCA0434 TaxID=3079297 RepID=UPI00290583B5|nr:1-acyl-sn-glycerol-3-phosphate acyltransferase [Roseobacter sp. HKCCA0434]
MTLRARDLTYASIARGPLGRATIRVVENLTGRIAVLRRLARLPAALDRQPDIWLALPDLFGLSIRITGEEVPSHGPLLVIANHPFGLADSLAVGHLLARTGRPFHIVANEVFLAAPPIRDVILPISFDKSREGQARNLATRRTATRILSEGGVVAVFPAGATESSPTPGTPPAEGRWSHFTGKLVRSARPTILPLHVAGHHGQMFHRAGFVHPNLRHALQIGSFARQMDGPIHVTVGKPLDGASLSHRFAHMPDLTEHLRQAVLALASQPIDPARVGHRF